MATGNEKSAYRSGSSADVYYIFKNGQLNLVTISQGTDVFSLNGDFAEIWFRLLDSTRSSDSTPTNQVSEKVLAFLSFLSENGLLPEQHSLESAIQFLCSDFNHDELVGSYQIEQNELSTPIFASWIEDAYGCDAYQNPMERPPEAQQICK